MRRAVGFVFLALSLRGQERPSVSEILARVGTAYSAATAYELIGDAKPITPVPRGTAGGRVLVAFRSPNQYRMEGWMPGIGIGDHDSAVTVSDGAKLWFYLPSENQYGSIDLKDLSDAAGDLADIRPEAFDRSVTGHYRNAAKMEGARILREEAIEFGGAKVDCYVVALAAGKQAYTWWIDKIRYRIIREDSPQFTIAFSSIQLTGSLPDDLFKFVPPSGAQKVELTK
jgi:outer membrane lipoprotein-sorting protein